MADPMDTLPFKTLVAQASAVLLTHGVEVEPTAVQGVATHLVETMAKQSGMDYEEVVHLVTAEAVAEVIMQAAAADDQRAAPPHAIRPVRIEDSAVSVPVEVLGHLVMAASQAGKYASVNDDGPAAAHLLDLATEIGAALVKRHADGSADIPVGILDELAELVDTVAERIEEDGWSICPCGEDHDQNEVDAGTVPVMRHHAALARGLREQAAG
ncbi:hypothetical protein SLV14_003642 [Streptomyces sp. Je 1-4]|uniref:hypothetical protein n=1 Tax=Streptomyces TaxID=1883 RepID=UPI0021D869AF|nr:MULTISPECIES: hypothetical protein [unclassified Streptomyces]UYB40962.1 hypothetical protein SLV14_003642 [Streptomyces sp. Je 1-4]UZQ37123.1 hypothetical protein SLV14N_003642 [Streptomyces sp. Je 1-4] [Streptomyces sp. Je 1-4 4N24]UZQ44540.1 hypothetical protein SLV14NA_003642 [Streptomyces sp. Je 1-4] [Streptomyces sp. Je 1-4 4N24_ara]